LLVLGGVALVWNSVRWSRFRKWEGHLDLVHALAFVLLVYLYYFNSCLPLERPKESTSMRFFQKKKEYVHERPKVVRQAYTNKSVGNLVRLFKHEL
jgi:hypothetical protein